MHFKIVNLYIETFSLYFFSYIFPQNFLESNIVFKYFTFYIEVSILKNKKTPNKALISLPWIVISNTMTL